MYFSWKIRFLKVFFSSPLESDQIAGLELPRDFEGIPVVQMSLQSGMRKPYTYFMLYLGRMNFPVTLRYRENISGFP